MYDTVDNQVKWMAYESKTLRGITLYDSSSFSFCCFAVFGFHFETMKHKFCSTEYVGFDHTYNTCKDGSFYYLLGRYFLTINFKWDEIEFLVYFRAILH